MNGVMSANRLETVNAGFVGRAFLTMVPAIGAPLFVRFGLQGTSMQGIASASATNDNVIAFSNSVWTSQIFSINTQGTRTSTGATFPNRIRWRLNGQNVATTANSAADADDLPHVVILKIIRTSIGPGTFLDTVTLFMDPIGSTEPSSTIFPSFSISDASFDRISVTAAGTGLFAKIAVDQFRIGTTWNAVTGTTTPVVQTISPSVGATVVKTSVTITGEQFIDPITVSFGGAPVAPTTTTATTLNVFAPPNATAGPVDVTVFNASGAASDTTGAASTSEPGGFTYQIPTAANPVPVVQPSLSGDPFPGGILTADPGQWAPSFSAFTFVWQRADDLGGTALLNVGTGLTYVVADGDFGKYLRVQVTPGSTTTNAFSPFILSHIPKASVASLSETVGPAGEPCGLGASSAFLVAAFLLLARRRQPHLR
ncbi:MAG: IPT/TIG domain-containing protein [Planctomycetes bacterium]|nr:IPT/TIG domain-containing protein [Planctomycetota bacterium]